MGTPWARDVTCAAAPMVLMMYFQPFGPEVPGVVYLLVVLVATLFGAWEAGQQVVPAGTIAVPMDQPLARLAFTLLEARSDDGFANWAILDESIEEGRYPVWRVPPGS